MNTKNLELDKLASYTDINIYKDKTEDRFVFEVIPNGKFTIADIMERIGGYLLSESRKNKED